MNRKEESYYFGISNAIDDPMINGSYKIVLHDDKPDFSLELGGKTIGVELSNLYQDNTGINKCSKLKQRDSVIDDISNLIMSQIKNNYEHPFSINISFIPNLYFKTLKRDTRKLNDISLICISELQLMKDREIKILNKSNGLPDEIYSIQITRFENLTEPVNLSCSGGILPDLTIERINQTIAIKEANLLHYKKHDEQWLLLVEGNGFASSFSDIFYVSSVDTKFDRVYLLRTAFKSVITIK